MMTGMTSERCNPLMDEMALLQYKGEEDVCQGYREEGRVGLADSAHGRGERSDD